MAHAQLLTAITFLLIYIYFVEDYRIYTPLHSIHAAIEFSLFPLLYMYLKSVISTDFNLKKHLPHLLPSLLALITASYIFYFYYSIDELNNFLANNRRGVSFSDRYNVLIMSRYISLAALVTQAVSYSCAFFKLPAEYNERLKKEFSNIEHLSVDWINNYLVGFALLASTGIAFYALFPITGINQHLLVVIFASFSAYMSRLGVLSLSQINVALVVKEDVLIDETKECIKDPKLQEQLIEYIEVRKMYLQPDINLSTLAKSLGTNRTYLSSFINQQYGKNFNTFINDYRAEYAKKILEENPTISKDALSQAAGFGSNSTLQRALNKVKA